MPVRHAPAVQEYPNKRARVESTTGISKSKTQTKTAGTTTVKPKITFTSAGQIKAALKQDSPDVLVETLTTLRNQLSVKFNEDHIPPQDPRLTLAKEWMEASPGAADLFTVLDQSTSSRTSSHSPNQLTSLILTILTHLLTLLSAHYINHPLGTPIVKALLTPARMRQLNGFIGGANNELVLVGLRVWLSLSEWAGGRERRGVLEGFGWEIKSLPKLLNMRRKSHGEKDTSDPLTRPDIRTLYTLLLLSFLSPTSPAHLKTLFLEQHRGAFTSIFKGLQYDHYNLVRRVLEVCWAGLWCDEKVKRTIKVGVFGEGVLAQLVKLYERTEPEDGQEDHIPADLVHHFLLAICTHPGTGICFKDRGWYPRESTDADELPGADAHRDVDKEEGDSSKKGRIYNKILANFVKTLKVNEDARQQELAMKILEACPELVAGYWSAAGLTLEPRLSSRWITNISIFGAIVSLPVPSSCFLLPGSSGVSLSNPNTSSPSTQQQYNPTPPPLSTILASFLPSPSSLPVPTKTLFTKGLQAPSPPLVQHLTALTLARCLLKYEQVMKEMKSVSRSLEEGEGEGEWARRIVEVEREVRKRVPDWGVVVGFGMGVGVGATASPATSSQGDKTQQGDNKDQEQRAQPPNPNPTRTALLAESAQRLLWLYHRSLPSVVAETRFDVGKLLQGFVRRPVSALEDGSRGSEDEDEDNEKEPDAATGLYRLQQLHILNLLKESDQFMWSSKIPSLGQTPFHVLLTALCSSNPESGGMTTSSSSQAIQNAVTSVLQRVLAQSILFQEDPDEPELWLDALPRQRQRAPVQAQDVQQRDVFEGEVEGVLAFLDDCIQRCLRTPYKYVEALQAVIASSTSGTHTSITANDTNSTQPHQTIDFSHLPSPLLPTLIEQLSAKLNGGLLPPSHVVGIAAYMRSLLYGLAAKAGSESAVEVVMAFAGRVQEILSKEMAKESGGVGDAVRREVWLMRACLAFGSATVSEVEGVEMAGPDADESQTPGQRVQALLDNLEAPRAQSKHQRTVQALSILNRVRLLPPSETLSTAHLAQIMRRLEELDASPLASELVKTLVSGQADVWDSLRLKEGAKELLPVLDFPHLLLHTDDKHLQDETCQAVLARSVFASRSRQRQGQLDAKARTTLVRISRCINLLAHKLAGVVQLNDQVKERDETVKGLFFLLNLIMKFARESEVLREGELSKLKEVVFGRDSVWRDAMMGSIGGGVVKGIQRLVDACLDPSSEADRELVKDISSHWSDVMSSASLVDSSQELASRAGIWLKFLPPSQLFDLLDKLQTSLEANPSWSPRLVQPITAVLQALSSVTSADGTHDAEEIVLKNLDKLVSLHSLDSVKDDAAIQLELEKVLAMGTDACLPLGVDGVSPLQSISDVVGTTRKAEGRWITSSRHFTYAFKPKLRLNIHTFLTQSRFSTWTITIIRGLLYLRSFFQSVVIDWLRSPGALQRDAEHLIPILHAFLDVVTVDNDEEEDKVDSEIWVPFIPILVRTMADEGAEEMKWLARESLLAIMSLASEESSKLVVVLDVLTKQVQALPEKQVSAELLRLGVELASQKKLGTKVKDILTTLIERGIRSCIDHFGDALESVEGGLLAEALTTLLQRTPSGNVKPVLVETLLTVVVQSRLGSVVALKLVRVALGRCQLKPVVVNRHLQSILQHPHFFKLCSSPNSSSYPSTPSQTHASSIHTSTNSARDALTALLHTLFHLHPTNTCQLTHIEPLLTIYRGTLSPADRRILSIFQLFERERKMSVGPLFARWSAGMDGKSETTLEALQSMDPVLLLRTCLNFPTWRTVDDEEDSSDLSDPAQGQAQQVQEELYDPVFLMLLFGQMLADQAPSSAVGWIELFRINVVSLFVRALSAKEGRMRSLALGVVVGVYRHLEAADLQEKPHVMYILNLLKDLMPSAGTSSSVADSPESQYPRRLPTYTTLLLAHALRAIFHPSHFIYPHTARFLLQRPTLDTTDVPMLYGLLYSSSDEAWKKERGWMLKFLADGMASSEDWRVLKRRHTWDLLASLFGSSKEGRDSGLRMAILEILANLTCNAHATTSLLLKSALLQWIEMQLLFSPSKSEGMEWVKILENILVVVDAAKIETATNGQWRAVICRCLGYLLDEQSCATTTENFPHAVPVILRLAALPGPPLANLPTLLDLATSCLEKMEASPQFTHVHTSPTSSTSDHPVLPQPPHRSYTLHQSLTGASVLLYAALLEMLWQTSMLMEKTTSAWGSLTPRMLLWGRRGGYITGVGERHGGGVDLSDWARKEVVRNLGVAQK